MNWIFSSDAPCVLKCYKLHWFTVAWNNLLHAQNVTKHLSRPIYCCISVRMKFNLNLIFKEHNIIQRFGFDCQKCEKEMSSNIIIKLSPCEWCNPLHRWWPRGRCLHQRQTQEDSAPCPDWTRSPAPSGHSGWRQTHTSWSPTTRRQYYHTLKKV